MKLGDFIKKFSHNNIVRLLYTHSGGHQLVLKDWNDVSMDWEIRDQKGKYRHFVDNKVIGFATVSFRAGDGIQYPEALNIVIERLSEQIYLDEVEDIQEKCESAQQKKTEIK